MKPRFARCGHVRDAANTKIDRRKLKQPKGWASCRRCCNATRRRRYHQRRAEGFSCIEIANLRPLSPADLDLILGRMKAGATIGAATAGPSGCHSSVLYARLRIWAPANRRQAALIRQLSNLNFRTQTRQRWEARRPIDEPDTFPRVDPKNLDFGLIEAIVQGSRLSDDNLRSDLRQALVVDLLEGRTCYDNLRLRARAHVTQHFKQSNSKWGHRSLDETISADSKMTLGDGISRGMWE